jgi:hypothetical protein
LPTTTKETTERNRTAAISSPANLVVGAGQHG